MLFYTQTVGQSQNWNEQNMSYMPITNGGANFGKCNCPCNAIKPECPFRKNGCPCKRQKEYTFVFQGKLTVIEKPKCPNFWGYF